MLGQYYISYYDRAYILIQKIIIQYTTLLILFNKKYVLYDIIYLVRFLRILAI